MRLKIDLEEDATATLIQRAAEQKRPVGWQAEVLLREALGLPSLPPKTVKASGKKKPLGMMLGEDCVSAQGRRDFGG